MDLLVPYFNTNRGAARSPMLSDDGGLLTQPASLALAHAAKQRKVFTAPAAAAGGVLPIFSNTAQLFGLWNPAGSGVVAIVREIAQTYVSTTGAAGGFVLGVVKNAGAGQGAAGQGITAWTDIPVFDGRTNGKESTQNKCRASSAATVVAPVILRHLGLNQLVITAADATNVQWKAVSQFEGDLQVEPNTAIFLAGNIATLIIMAPSFTWEEEAA